MDLAVESRRRQGAAARVEQLTETQRQCLRLTYQHRTSKEIAPLLGLSPHSVDAHIRIAMKVLGVNNRREAALVLHDRETAQPARRKPTNIHYEPSAPAPCAYVSEGPSPDWTYPSDGSNMAVVNEHSQNISGMDTLVEQSGPTSAVTDPNLKDNVSRPSSWADLENLDAKKKVIVILLTSFLSAMTFTLILSGLAALSILLSGQGSAE